MIIKRYEEALRDEETANWLRANFDRHQKEGWQVWEEPWFKREHPVHYFFLSRFSGKRGGEK